MRWKEEYEEEDDDADEDDPCGEKEARRPGPRGGAMKITLDMATAAGARIKEERGVFIATYLAGETFDNPVMRECRGAVFAPSGECIARPLHKFFNVGELESTQPNSIEWHRAARVMVKRDGSMIHPVRLPNGDVKLKTKSTFESEHALYAAAILTGEQRDWINRCVHDGATPVFELTSPRFPIVVRYQEDQLTLLHMRRVDDGSYLSMAEVAQTSPPFAVDDGVGAMLPVDASLRWPALKHAAEITEGVEGWVVQFDDGEMLKVKTNWYQQLHHAVTFVRWRDIARAVVAGRADDLLGHFALCGRDVTPVRQVMRSIQEHIDGVRVETATIAQKCDGLSLKEIAIAANGHPLFAQVMMLVRGKPVDWMAWYDKHYLESTWSLEVVP